MKQIVLVNESLNLPQGKIAAQFTDTSVTSLLASGIEAQKSWLRVDMPKVVLAANTEEGLMGYYHVAMEAEIPAQLIKDAGKTVVAAVTVTCMCIDLALETGIDLINSGLKLVTYFVRTHYITSDDHR